MSLDFFLYHENERPCACVCGHAHTKDTHIDVASFNITHNLNTMAQAAGVYGCLWRPEEQTPAIRTAAQCAPLLRAGLVALKAFPTKFNWMSAPNGWGTYEQFVPWVELVLVLAACEANPTALVRASR